MRGELGEVAGEDAGGGRRGVGGVVARELRGSCEGVRGVGRGGRCEGVRGGSCEGESARREGSEGEGRGGQSTQGAARFSVGRGPRPSRRGKGRERLGDLRRRSCQCEKIGPRLAVPTGSSRPHNSPVFRTALQKPEPTDLDRGGPTCIVCRSERHSHTEADRGGPNSAAVIPEQGLPKRGPIAPLLQTGADDSESAGTPKK